MALQTPGGAFRFHGRKNAPVNGTGARGAGGLEGSLSTRVPFRLTAIPAILGMATAATAAQGGEEAGRFSSVPGSRLNSGPFFRPRPRATPRLAHGLGRRPVLSC